MKASGFTTLLARIDAAEYGLCRRLNRGAARALPRRIFQIASRLGDGVVWYLLINRAAAPLDRYSFPSGHTLHAVSFTWQACAHFPELAWVLLPLAALIAGSRVVLGLHYPSDVLAGAAVGAALAELGLACS